MSASSPLQSCGQRRFPPREICSRCLSRDGEWVRSSGRGEIFSYNVMHQVYHPGFAAEAPPRGRPVARTQSGHDQCIVPYRPYTVDGCRETCSI